MERKIASPKNALLPLAAKLGPRRFSLKVDVPPEGAPMHRNTTYPTYDFIAAADEMPRGFNVRPGSHTFSRSTRNGCHEKVLMPYSSHNSPLELQKPVKEGAYELFFYAFVPLVLGTVHRDYRSGNYPKAGMHAMECRTVRDVDGSHKGEHKKVVVLSTEKKGATTFAELKALFPLQEPWQNRTAKHKKAQRDVVLSKAMRHFLSLFTINAALANGDVCKGDNYIMGNNGIPYAIDGGELFNGIILLEPDAILHSLYRGLPRLFRSAPPEEINAMRAFLKQPNERWNRQCFATVQQTFRAVQSLVNNGTAEQLIRSSFATSKKNFVGSGYSERISNMELTGYGNILASITAGKITADSPPKPSPYIFGAAASKSNEMPVLEI